MEHLQQVSCKQESILTHVPRTPPHEVAVSWNTELWIQDDIPDWQDIFIQVWANTSIWGNPDYKRRVQFCEWSTAQHCQGEWLPGSSITAQSEILYVTQFQERVFTYQILVWVNSTPIDNELCVSGVMDLTGYFASDKDGLVDQESVSGELK